MSTPAHAEEQSRIPGDPRPPKTGHHPGRRLAAALVLAAAASALAWWLPRRHDVAPPVLRTAVVTRGDVAQRITATGTLSPVNTVQVGSQVSGQIANLGVDFNDSVTAGQLIAEIDPSTYAAAVGQAEAELASVGAALDLRRLEARRAADLLAQHLIAQSEFDAAAVALRQQEATMQIRTAALENARLNLQRTRILAPITGTILSRSVSIGQTVQASFSAPELFQIAQDLRQMEIAAAVSEADIGGVAPGQPVTFSVDAFPERTFHGTVRQVRNNPVTTQNVVTYATIISVTNDDLTLRPGMTATATITTASRQGVLRVPNAALRFTPPAGVPVRNATAPGAASAVTAGAPAAASGSRERPPTPEGGLDGAPPPPPLPGGASRSAGDRPTPTRAVAQNDSSRQQTVYLAGEGGLTAVTVLTGIADATMGEILAGLQEGDVVTTGIALVTDAAEKTTTSTVNPFAPTPPGRR